MERKEILEAARKCVCCQREQDYGSPEDNFATIAHLWTAYLSKKLIHTIEPLDVAMMMALLKIARTCSGNVVIDNFIDLAGYAACGGEIAAGIEMRGGEK